MPDPWLAGVYRDPGRNAGYNSGRNAMRRAVAHFTVGSDSRPVGRNGYFHFLVHRDASRENGCTQYAEIDAVTWHGYKAGYYDANSAGPGIEFERLVTGGINAEGLSDAQPLTENQIVWGSRIVAFCAEWGIPVRLYDGPRYQYGDWSGWINHQALDSDRSDGLLRAEWNLISGAPAPAHNKEIDIVYQEKETGTYYAEGLGGFYGVEKAVGVGVGLNGGAVVPVTAAQMKKLGDDKRQQAIAFLKDAGVI